jgi:hypothetical protein
MPDIHHLIQIQAKPETVVSLIARPAGLAEWWAEDVFDVSTAACSLGFFNRGTIYRLSLESGSAPKVVWKCESGKEWQGTSLIFSVVSNGAGSSLRFTHAGWQAETDYFTSCNTTWGELMFRLMAVAQGQNVGPLFKKSGIGY